MAINKILIVAGTRPEVVKTAMLYRQLVLDFDLELVYCLTGQHLEILAPFLELFNIQPNEFLDAMNFNSSLESMLSFLLEELGKLMIKHDPDLVLVQGDTLSCFAGALSAFHHQIPVGHIEAGLRTYNINAPFPEEGYRKMVDAISTYHFAPTALAKKRLLDEGNKKDIPITGNTGIDALLYLKSELINKNISVRNKRLLKLLEQLNNSNKKSILLTLHRREIQNDQFQSILEGIESFAEAENLHIIFPVHKNPNVKKRVLKNWKKTAHISLLEPLAYEDFIWAMMHVDMIVTDSGGIQEEAPYLGKKVVVIRDQTERTESLGSGSFLSTTNKREIIANCKKAWQTELGFESQPYGDGKASRKIIQFIKAIK